VSSAPADGASTRRQTKTTPRNGAMGLDMTASAECDARGRPADASAGTMRHRPPKGLTNGSPGRDASRAPERTAGPTGCPLVERGRRSHTHEPGAHSRARAKNAGWGPEARRGLKRGHAPSRTRTPRGRR
jgi:hypothetical protein